MLVENMLMLPVAMVLAESGKNTGAIFRDILLQSFKRLARNPVILAILAGLSFALLEIRLPEPVTRAIDMLAMASAPVAIFVIGGALVGFKLKGMIGDALQIAGGKLLLHPFAVFTAVMLLPSIDPQLQMAAVIFACVPMLSIYPIIGLRYRLESICAAALMAATIASFLTISAVLWIIEASRVFAGPV
jgi:predicted permease